MSSSQLRPAQSGSNQHGFVLFLRTTRTRSQAHTQALSLTQYSRQGITEKLLYATDPFGKFMFSRTRTWFIDWIGGQ